MTASGEGITRQFLELRGKEGSLSAGLAGREADVKGLETAIAQTEERLTVLSEDLAAGQARQAEARKNLDDCQAELKTAGEAVTAAGNTIAGYTLRQESRRKRQAAAEEKRNELSTRLNSVSAKAKVYRAMERDFESYQKSVRLVMQEAGRGALRGIHGPVSRLIRTDDQYTVAIEIALGGRRRHALSCGKYLNTLICFCSPGTPKCPPHALDSRMPASPPTAADIRLLGIPPSASQRTAWQWQISAVNGAQRIPRTSARPSTISSCETCSHDETMKGCRDIIGKML